MDDLLHYNEAEKKMPIPPKGKHIFGTATLGERGQIVLPKKARELFDLKSGDTFIVLADESPESGGIALVPVSYTHLRLSLLSLIKLWEHPCGQ